MLFKHPPGPGSRTRGQAFLQRFPAKARARCERDEMPIKTCPACKSDDLPADATKCKYCASPVTSAA